MGPSIFCKVFLGFVGFGLVACRIPCILHHLSWQLLYCLAFTLMRVNPPTCQMLGVIRIARWAAVMMT